MEKQTRMKRIFAVLLLLTMALSLMGPGSASAAKDQGEKVVRVGYVNSPAYEEGGEGEYKTGSGYEYLQKISYHTGWKYEYVYGTFRELYDKLVAGEIDLFGNVSYTEERAQLFHFSSYPQGRDTYYLYTLPDRADLLGGNIQRLQGTRIGVTEHSYQEILLGQWLQENGIQAEVIRYDGYEPSMDALDAGEIDAVATPNLSGSSYNYATIIDIGFSEYYFAVAKDRTDLLAELNEALYAIQTAEPNYNAALESKYQVSMLSDTYLNEKESAWLARHDNTIRLGYLNNNLPYSNKNATGKFTGVLQALADSLEEKFGVSVKATCYDTTTELKEALETGEVDTIGPWYSDYWLAEQHDLIQTNTAISSTAVLFYKNTSKDRQTDVIAVTDSSFLGEAPASILFPEAEIVTYQTVEDCLNAVLAGHADSAVAAASQLNLMKQYNAAEKLQIAEVSKQIDICLCTMKSDPELAGILNKCISVSSKTLSGAVLSQNSYFEKEFTLRDFIESHMVLFGMISVVVIVILLLVVAYMIYSTRRVSEVNASIVRKQDELQKALRTAEQANRAKTTFLANMSHDIRTPINGIMGMLGMIDKNQDDPVKTQECLGKIRTSSEHLLQLINDVLDLSRMESGEIQLEHVPFNLQQVGEEALSMVEGQAVSAGLRTVAEHLDGSDIWLMGSPLHFKQIMLNLYTNAMKYNKPGGLIYTNMEEVSRTVDTITLKLTVRDTGIGMTKDFVEHELFVPFVQGENGARTKYKGSGLGMTIVKDIVEQMHGSISVESKVNEGTTFTVILPFEIDHSEHAERELEDETLVNITGTRILVVEDNELNMEIAEFILREAGAVVTKAENGSVAVKTFADAPVGSFDLILMDIMMPVMNGIQATTTIRQLDRPDAKTTPIFAMTANAFSSDVNQCIQAGMNEHVAKPLDAAKMLRLIARYTKKSGGDA